MGVMLNSPEPRRTDDRELGVNMKNFALSSLLFLSACTMDNGSNWALADFNKYDQNYKPIPRHLIQMGDTKNEIIQKLGSGFSIESVSQKDDVAMESWRYNKWKSATGPDYVDDSIIITFRDGKVIEWGPGITKTTTVPLSF